MGVVYRARQLGLNRLVALKMIHAGQLLSDEARLRFNVEIEAVAQLHHPHIVSLYDSGEHEGTHYFTMRLVEGGDLTAHLNRGRPLRELIQLVVKVCRAVHYAHQRGILHRDLKPSNILVDEQGEPHVADFGLAKSVDPDSGFTFTASVLGSPNYMAPEQAIGKTRQLTTAVDVYGLGAILYHVLAGRPPFQAKTPIATLRQVIDDDAVSPRSFNRQVDADLETICLKCLRKEPGQRYDSAEEVAQDLERWLSGRAILARPLGMWAGAWRWSRRHPVAAALAIALVAAMATIAVGSGIAVVRIQQAERQSAASLRESLLREASSYKLGSQLGHRAESLRLIKQAAQLGGPPEFRLRARNELLAMLARTDLTFVPAKFSPQSSSPELNRLDAEFERLATVEHGTNILIRALTNGEVLKRLASQEVVFRIESFSPNGRFLALRHTNSLSVWDLHTGGRCLTHTGTNNTFAFAPNEDTLLFQDVPNEAVLLELPSGRERARWRSVAPRAGRRIPGWHTFAFSRDGRIVAGSSGTSGIVELMDPETGEQLRLLTNSAHIVAMGWSRYGGALAVATADSRVTDWNPRTGAVLWTSPPMIAPARSITYHPRGDWVAVVCEDEQVRFIDPFAQDFAVKHAGWSEQIAFAPDRNWLGPVWLDGQWGWLEMRAPEEFAQYRVGSSLFRLDDAAFSADGQMLAVGHSDKVILCDPERGTPLRSKDEWRMSACAFHPGGKELFVTGPEGILCHSYRYPTPGEVSFSPRSVVHPGNDWQAMEFSVNGRFFVAYDERKLTAFVFDHTLTNLLATLGPHTNVGRVTISRDGRWVATAAGEDRFVRVWNVAEEKEILSVAAGLHPQGLFSADGRWLAITGDREFRLLETGSWKEVALPLGKGRPILGSAAFSPDSRMLGLVVDRFTIHLFDLQRRELLGILRPPNMTHLRGLAFSPDGLRLAAVGPEARVSIWNLRKVQDRLEEFGLAWK
jgi:WD40 repeat protein